MADTPTIKWPGESGQTYTYYMYPIGTQFDAKAGNYIFAKETSPNRWTPIYIGETGDLSERFNSHHATPCIERNQATHIHAHVTSTGRAARLAEETDLVRHWKPVCNR